jgi:hypothetical protein
MGNSFGLGFGTDITHLLDSGGGPAAVDAGTGGLSMVWVMGPPMNISVDFGSMILTGIGHLAPVRPFMVAAIWFAVIIQLARWIPSQFVGLPE